jgi:Helix-turn-helix domain
MEKLSEVAKGESLTLSVEEAAKLAGMGRNQAYEACRSGKFPVLHVNRRYLVLKGPFMRLLGAEA